MTLITKEMSIMVLPCPFYAVLMMCFIYRGHAYQLYGFAMTSNKGGKPITCLTNHKGTISHSITPLVINSLGDRHTHAYRYCGQKQFQETNCVPAKGRQVPKSLT